MAEVLPQYEELLVEVILEPKSTYVVLDRAVKYIQKYCQEQPMADIFTSIDELTEYLRTGEEIVSFSRPVELAGTLTIDPHRKSISYVTGLKKGKVEFFVFDDLFVFKGTIGSWSGGWSEYINWNRLYGEIKRITILKEKEHFIRVPYHKFRRTGRRYSNRGNQKYSREKTGYRKRHYSRRQPRRR